MDLSALDPVKLIVALIIAATPLVLAAIGELIVEKSGVLNLGVEGMMIMGAIGGFSISVITGSPYIGIIAGGVAGLFLSLIFAFLTQILRTNQVATGLALTMFGLGTAALIGQPFNGIKPPSSVRLTFLDAFKDVSLAGAIFVILSISSVIWVQWFLRHSKSGLILRAVGENHDAAHSIGYNVVIIRVAAIAFGGFMAGLGGACISLVRVPQWTEGMTAGIGWIALALVVFGSWRPWRVLAGAYLFGVMGSAQVNLQTTGLNIRPEYLAMMPYIMTIIVLVLISSRAQNLDAPASLGKPFQGKS